jgi:hypothetical protein
MGVPMQVARKTPFIKTLNTLKQQLNVKNDNIDKNLSRHDN